MYRDTLALHPRHHFDDFHKHWVRSEINTAARVVWKLFDNHGARATTNNNAVAPEAAASTDGDDDGDEEYNSFPNSSQHQFLPL